MEPRTTFSSELRLGFLTRIRTGNAGTAQSGHLNYSADGR
jgi:hypothetical protein